MPRQRRQVIKFPPSIEQSLLVLIDDVANTVTTLRTYAKFHGLRLSLTTLRSGEIDLDLTAES